ncbi:MAG: hypothetical protein XD80_1536 [Synergistales bacterium 53_16]|nr:MAG: hypothetical protein XD80_1536 [Synergistales bacterium 53_16]
MKKIPRVSFTKFVFVALLELLFCFTVARMSLANPVMARWAKTQEFSDKYGGVLEITATYYSEEYIEALVAEEAEKNLWTKSEMDSYTYQLIKSLQLDEYIPVHFYIKNTGPSMHMAPFGDQVVLWVAGKKYSPADYDRRFNFKVDDTREGLVFFPRYDEKTGKDLLEGAKSVRLVFNGGVSSITIGKNIEWVWDVHRDNPKGLIEGSVADRLETDRLINRLQKLNAQKAELEEQMQKNADEIAKIEARLEELQGK